MKDGQKGMIHGQELGIFTEDSRKSGEELLVRLTDDFSDYLNKAERNYMVDVEIAGHSVLNWIEDKGLDRDDDKLVNVLYIIRKYFVSKQKTIQMFENQNKKVKKEKTNDYYNGDKRR